MTQAEEELRSKLPDLVRVEVDVFTEQVDYFFVHNPTEPFEKTEFQLGSYTRQCMEEFEYFTFWGENA